ncbi:MAG TPA: hypothetical protein VFA08_01000 [Actinomycetota bacterium]|jgi:hypothetical protein|nr:hypothetical protein [Actinomycetota bacterium]
MTDGSDADRDIVRELHGDQRWSTWTNSIERWRRRQNLKGSLRRDPGIGTFMLAALIVVGVVVGVIAFVVFVFTLG